VSPPGATGRGPGAAPGSNPAAPVGIGVDIGGTKVLGVAVDPSGSVLAEARASTPHGTGVTGGTGGAGGAPPPEPGAGSEAVADAVAAVVADVRAALDVPDLPVGVGAPGMVDRNGVLRYAPNLQAATGADIRALVTERLTPTTVVVENDANCAVHAEHTLGAGQGYDEVLFVALGTGIGGGMVSGGRIVLGAFGFAGEIGHMLINPSGPPCPCGQRGCWERYASGAGLGMLAREGAYAGRLPAVVALAGGDAEAVRGEHVTQAAADGDRAAAAVLEELGWWVAAGLANLTAVVDPARIVLGGGLVTAGDLLVAPTRRAYVELVEGSGRRPEVDIVPAALGERAGAVGAALAAAQGGLA
jgi:glucokinase